MSTINRFPVPAPDDLPEDIRDFVLHQKHDVTQEHFGRDVASLIAAIETLRHGKPRAIPWARIATIGVAAMLLIGALPAYRAGLWWLEESRWSSVEAGDAMLGADRNLRDCLTRLRLRPTSRVR